MKPATDPSWLVLGIPAGVALVAVLAAAQPPRAAGPAPVPYLTSGGPCGGGTRLCPDGTCQAPGVRSCGASCSDCTLSNPANSTASCSSGGSCTFTCVSGYHNCSSACLSNTSTSSCGASCTACPGPALGPGTATCDGTSCGLSCASGYWQSAATDCSSQSFTASH